jgi:hypothetical protein
MFGNDSSTAMIHGKRLSLHCFAQSFDEVIPIALPACQGVPEQPHMAHVLSYV